MFLDGVGIGTQSQNPIIDLFKGITKKDFITDNIPMVNSEFTLKGIDPILGVRGIPQSATGQTSIMTGINSQKVLGYHHTAFPNSKLIELINSSNLLREAKEMGYRTTCGNIYSREYFEKRSKRRKNMFPVSALSVMNADLGFRFIEDYNKGRAVFASITNSLKPITPEQAAKDMLNISKDYDLIFFEYFLTDSYGHKKNREKLEYETRKLNRFINNIWLEGNEWLDIVITSDHGNSEDISTGDHTKNLVPLLYLSKNSNRANYAFNNINNIADIKDVILKLLGS